MGRNVVFRRRNHKLEKKSRLSMLVLMVLIDLKLAPVISYQRMEAVNKACFLKFKLSSFLSSLLVLFHSCSSLVLLLGIQCVLEVAISCFLLYIVIFALSFLTLLIPVKVYDLSVLKWKIWDCLFDYYS